MNRRTVRFRARVAPNANQLVLGGVTPVSAKTDGPGGREVPRPVPSGSREIVPSLATGSRASGTAGTSRAKNLKTIETGSEPVPTGSQHHPRPVPVSLSGETGTGSRGAGVLVSEIQELALDAGSDVLALGAEHWPSLPLAATLRCESLLGGHCYVTNSRPVWQALRRLRRAVFGMLEFEALSSAYRVGRNNPHTLFGWCEIKRKTPTWRLSLFEALGCRVFAAAYKEATIGQVLAGWGVVLVGLSYGGELPGGEP